VDIVCAEHRDGDEIWQAALASGRFLITQELDFSDVRRFAPATYAGLLLLRPGQPGRDALVAGVAALFANGACR
jgi:hypothetical protein